MLKETVRVIQPGGWIFVRALLRPASEDAVGSLVEMYAANATKHQRALFDASSAQLSRSRRCARSRAAQIDPDAVKATSDRH